MNPFAGKFFFTLSQLGQPVTLQKSLALSWTVA
jgi:hypothetical protein